jgi:hypothetical protein
MEFIKGKEFIKTQYNIKEINFERPKFKREINTDNTTTARNKIKTELLAEGAILFMQNNFFLIFSENIKKTLF